ncbi:MAG: hypothetical protein ACFBSE_21585 [Prochloraceae cyanobacterium]
MGLDISILEPKKVNASEINDLDYDYITFLTENGIKTKDAEVLKCFEALFFEREIEYYDPIKGLKNLGYIRDDVYFEGFERYWAENWITGSCREDFRCQVPGTYKVVLNTIFALKNIVAINYGGIMLLR